jgi:predicted N-acyltransferase
MMLSIRSNWKNFDHYLEDMTTKYRTRAKRAFKKMDGLKCLELDEMLLERHKTEIFNLYLNIAKGVGFNLIELHQDYFLEMKKTFGESLMIRGIFEHNTLVGFYTTLHNYDELETGFLGFEEKYNPTHQLYLNLLYDMVRQGIEKGVKRIVFARTAMEIKSSVGAEPHTMHTYVRHNNRFVNPFLPKIIQSLSPKAEWVQRKPFKENES